MVSKIPIRRLKALQDALKKHNINPSIRTDGERGIPILILEFDSEEEFAFYILAGIEKELSDFRFGRFDIW